MFDYIFFDLDGTLTRSGDGIKKSSAHAIAQLGYPALSEAQLDTFVGPPLLESFMRCCGMDEQTALRAVEIYRVRYEEVGWRENAVYPGVAQLLRALRAAGKHVSIVTAKPEYFAVRIADHFGLAPYMDSVVGIPLNDHHADKATLIRRALPAGVDKSRVVMVGDRKYDVQAARDTGVRAIGVGYGYGTREELSACGPDFFTETVSGLFGLLGVERPRGRFSHLRGYRRLRQIHADGARGRLARRARLGDRAHARAGRLPRGRAHPRAGAGRRRRPRGARHDRRVRGAFVRRQPRPARARRHPPRARGGQGRALRSVFGLFHRLSGLWP